METTSHNEVSSHAILPFVQSFAESWLPFLLLLAVYIFFMRTMKNKPGMSLKSVYDEQVKTNQLLSEISKKLDNR